jgi:hypothetical protein
MVFEGLPSGGPNTNLSLSALLQCGRYLLETFFYETLKVVKNVLNVQLDPVFIKLTMVQQ